MKRTIDTIIWPSIGFAIALMWILGACRAAWADTNEPPKVCTHEWVKGPFWIKAAISWEEPTCYPPQGIINIEHCIQCGLLRLPPDLKSKLGPFLRDNPSTWTMSTNSINGASLTNLFRSSDGLSITNTGTNLLIVVTNR